MDVLHTHGAPLAPDSPAPEDFVRYPVRTAPLVDPLTGTYPTPEPGGGGSPTISLSALTTTFSATVGGANPASQTIDILNSGSGTLTFIASSNVPWVTVTPTSGQAPGTLTLSCNTTDLPAGPYVSTVTVTASGATNSPQVITITLFMTAGTTPPPDPPLVTRPVWLGYYKVAGRNIPGDNLVLTATTGAGNCALVLGESDDFADTQNWQVITQTAAGQLATINATLVIRGSAACVQAAIPYWGQVSHIYAAAIAGDPADIPGRLVALETRIADIRRAIWDAQLPNRPIVACLDLNIANTALGAFHYPYGADYYAIEAYVGPPFTTTYPTTAGDATIQMQGVISTQLALIPSDRKVFLIGQAYDRNGSMTNQAALTALTPPIVDALRSDGRIAGVWWFNYYRPNVGSGGGTAQYPDAVFRDQHTALFRACVGGRPPVETPPWQALGAIEQFDTGRWVGWAFDPDAPSTVTQVTIFNGPRPATGTAGRVSQVSCNVSRPDLNAITRSTTGHGFDIPRPASAPDGATYHLYGVSTAAHYGNYQTPLHGSPRAMSTSPTPTPTGGFTVSGRGFLYNGAAFNWRGITWFKAARVFKDSGAGALNLANLSASGVTVIRVLGMCANMFQLFPSESGYWTSLEAFADACESAGIAMEYVVFADTHSGTPSPVPGMTSQATRLAHIRTVAQRLHSRRRIFIEICNEPDNVPWQNISVTDLQELANAYLAIDGSRLIALGSTGGSDDTDLRYHTTPATYHTFHAERNAVDAAWVHKHGSSYAPVDSTSRPPVSDEPINAWDDTSGRVNDERYPAYWYFWAVLSRLRPFSTTFHCQEARMCTWPFNSNVAACLAAWKAGLDAVAFGYSGEYAQYRDGNTVGTLPIILGSPAPYFMASRVQTNEAYTIVHSVPDWNPQGASGWATPTLVAQYEAGTGHRVRLYRSVPGVSNLREMTADERATLAAYAAVYPVNPECETEDGARAWTGRCAQQFKYTHGDFWGHKRADPGRPLSKDAIAYNDPANYPLMAYDLLRDSASPNVQLNSSPSPIDITGQVFVPVTAANYI